MAGACDGGVGKKRRAQEEALGSGASQEKI